MSEPSGPDRDELWELYKIAIDEYRFQVQLNWDRCKAYLVLNTALLSIGTGLVKLGAQGEARILIGLIFFVGAFCGGLAWHATWKGHTYYRRHVYKKTLLAEALGLLERLPGKQEDIACPDVAMIHDPQKQRRILAQPAEYISQPSLARETVSSFIQFVFGLFTVVDLAALIWVLSR